ncbi:sodium:calcium antiporter [Halobaculum sp. P14]|uniref:sodium:calcium antiporter n=1 Tax=Halobaculum sp. P14 TaxID=3421638 RepID=UPI003EBFCECC
MLFDFGALVVGLVLLVYGSNRIVASATSLARHAGVSTFFIGVTVVAVGSSIPEIATSVYGAAYDTGGFVVSHIVGSATSQITLGIGVVALAGTLTVPREKTRLYGAEMVLAMAAMLLAVRSGVVTRLEGVLMAAGYAAFLAVGYEHDDYQSMVERHTADRGPRTVAWLVVGLSMVVAGGHLLVTGARGVAVAVGVPWYLLGVVTGLGTTAPEIAIALLAVRRSEESVAVGTLLGSNITDPLFSLGVGAAVDGIVVEQPDTAVVSTAYMLAASVAVLAVLYRQRTVRWRDATLCLLLYVPTFLIR